MKKCSSKPMEKMKKMKKETMNHEKKEMKLNKELIKKLKKK